MKEKNVKVVVVLFTLMLMLSAPLSLSSEGTGSTDMNDGSNSANQPSPDLAIEKQMIFFLHYVNGTETAKPLPGGGSTWTYFDTTLEWNDVNVTIKASGTNQRYEWYLCPALAGNFTTDSFTFRIWGNASGSASVSAQTKIRVLRVNSTGAESLIHEENFGNVPYPISPTLKNFTANFTSTTFLPGESIKIEFEVTPGVSNTLFFYYDTARANSRLELRSSDSFRIENIRTLDYLDMVQMNFDPSESNKTIKIRANLTDPLGAYDIKRVNLTLYDPNGTIILDNVTMWKISGNPVDYRAEYNYTWNYSAYASFRGRYNISIWAVDNNGYNWYYHFQNYNFGDYYEIAHSYFYIGKMPNYAWVKVYDDSGTPLEGSVVQAVLSGSVVSWNITNQSGMTNITVSPGTYNLRVLWQDIYVGGVVANVSENITEDTPIIINCSVYYPILRAVDSWGLPLDGSVFYIQHPNGTKLNPMTANADGEITLYRAPLGNYSVVVRWRGIVVYDGVVFIDSSNTYILSCSVYHVTFHAQDPDGNPLSDIGIAVFDDSTGLIMDFRQTDFEGNATTRIPAGTVRVEAYWQNLLVNRTSNLMISGDDYIEVECEIYTVTFHASDSHDLPVQSAQIFIKTDAGGDVIDSVITDSKGNASSVLPNGTYYMEVIWNTVVVNSGYVTITDTTDVINVDCSIYYITFHTVDSHGADISNAQITVKTSTTGASLGTAFTDDKGNATIRLPMTETEVEVYWHETVVYSGTYVVSGDGTYRIDCSIYYITFHTVDSHGADISNAQITVKTSTTGASLGTAFTDDKGNATIRLPMTETEVEVYWHSILVNHSMYSVTEDSQVYVNCSVYYRTFHVVDSASEPVEGASITIWDFGNNVRKTAVTNSTGYAEFRVPSAEYNMEVKWMSTLVNQSTIFIDSDGTDTIYSLIYYITFELRDSREVPVFGASVDVYFEKGGQAGSSFTDEDGKTTMRLPKNTYDVKAYWDGILVNASSISVDNNANVNVSCAIYYLEITSVDSHETPLINAQVLALREGMTKSAVRTDSAGRSEHRLAVGTYDVRIFWQETLVYEGNIELNEDIQTNARCEVYYLTVSSKDSGGTPVKDAFISVTSANGMVFSKYTPENGTVTFRLAVGTYDVSARYRGEYLLTSVDVSSRTTVDLSSDSEISLKFDEHPSPIYATNLFYIILAVIVLMAGTVYFFMRQKKLDSSISEEGGELTDDAEDADMEEKNKEV